MKNIPLIKSQQIKYYLSPGKVQTESLFSRGIQATHKGKFANGQKVLKLKDESVIPEIEYLTFPEQHLAHLVEAYWNFYEITLDDLHNSSVTLNIRSLFEHVYGKIMVYILERDFASQKNIATKSLLCSIGPLVNVNDTKSKGSNYLLDYNHLLTLLDKKDRSVFEDIQKANYPITAIAWQMNNLYGKKGVDDALKRNEKHLVLANSDSTTHEKLIKFYKWLHGSTHLNSFDVAMMKTENVNKNYLYRTRILLCTISYQLLNIINEEILKDNKVHIIDTAKYYSRITKLGSSPYGGV